MADAPTGEPHRARIRLTATLPTGLIVYRSADFEWPAGTPLDLTPPMRPLLDWLAEEFEEWR